MSERPPGRVRRAARALRRLLSRIGLRLLTFNALLVFLPLGAVITLDRTELRLIEAQEASMVQQGRLVAAALADPRVTLVSSKTSLGEAQDELADSTVPRPEAADPLELQLRRDVALGLLWRLEQQTTARIRVLDRSGEVLVDSSVLGPRREPGGAAVPTEDDAETEDELRQRLVYRVGALPFRLYQELRRVLRGERDAGTYRRSGSAGPPWTSAVNAALDGRYGAASARAPEARETMLHSALPIRAKPGVPLALMGSSAARGALSLGPLPAFPDERVGEILGVVLVSQSTAQILADLDAARLAVGRVVVGSLVAAVLLSLWMAGTIARPLRRLRRDAEQLLDAGGRLVGEIDPPRRHDEIGDLRVALRSLADRLRKQQETAESFAADVAHEIKNPLAAIRSATEVLTTVDDPQQRERFAGLVLGNVARAEQLLSSLRDLAAIDVGLEEDRERVGTAGLSALPGCDLVAICRQLVDSRVAGGATVAMERAPTAAFVRGRPERLEQVIDNLVENALGFSPDDGTVEVTIDLERSGGSTPGVVLRVLDRGPGIPEADVEKIFRRFYSYRPQGQSTNGGNTGLGLAIVRSVIEAYGGSVVARNRVGGGAVFECRLVGVE